MGEYAKRKSDSADVKIGTCEDMYYLRYDQRHAVSHIPGNVDPARHIGLRWRLPFPDEDRIQPGSFDEYNRAIPLMRNGERGVDYFSAPHTVEDAGVIQLKHEPSGLLINVPCYHGEKLPNLGENVRAFWNGKGYSYVLSSVKNTEDGMRPIIRCRHCNHAWRSTWEEVLPFVNDKTMRERLEELAGVTA